VPFDVAVQSRPAVVSLTAEPATVSMTSNVAAGVRFAVENTGRTTATDLVATVTLPEAVFWADDFAVTTDWTCGAGVARGSNTEVECTLDSLAPAALVPGGSPLVLPVRAEGAVAGRAITVTLEGRDGRGGSVGDDAQTTLDVTVRVPSLSVDLPATTAVTQGVPFELAIPVRNTGTATATNLVATVRLDTETFWEGQASGSPWTCPAHVDGAGATVVCRLSTLEPGATTADLVPILRVNGNKAGRVISVDVSADGGISAHDTTAIVVSTGTPLLELTGLRTTVDAGEAGVYAFAVRNVGDGVARDLHVVVISLGRPWDGSDADPWTCNTGLFGIVLDCSLDELSGGATSRLEIGAVTTTPGSTTALARASAANADGTPFRSATLVAE
jgi:hypothetical protein